MHRQACGTSLLIVLLAVGSDASQLQDPEPPTPLREGRWRTRNYRSPIGHGSDKGISLEKSKEGWTITLTVISYPGVGRGDPTETQEGPFRVTAKDQLLEYETPRGRERHTFRFDGKVLVVPAVVQKDDQTWMLETTWVARPGKEKADEHTVAEKYV
jgi:hypothetical protein